PAPSDSETAARARSPGLRRTSQHPSASNSLLQALEQRRLPLADTDAERRQAVAAAAAAQLVEQRDDQSPAPHPERVPDRDRPAVHVHLLVVESELTDDGKALGRKRFVQLDEIKL